MNVFLEPLYQWLLAHFSDRINHFPLIRLLMMSLDHTLLIFIGWLLLWCALLAWKHHKEVKIAWRWEFYRHGFIFYMLLLFQLTIFRQTNLFDLLSIQQQPLSAIQWVPFVDSIKLFQHGSTFAAYYNVFGNIFWFMPLGLFCGMLYGVQHGKRWACWIGLVTSIIIEASQFIFMTGVTHIDDVICNVLGSLLGFWMYQKYQGIKGERNGKRDYCTRKSC